MQSNLLTDKQSYITMFYFLEAYFERTKDDEVGALLGAMSLADDGSPMDPAMWDEWLTAIARVRAEHPLNSE